MMKKYILPIFLLVMFSCAQDDKAGWQPVDLLEYGLPITVKAPDSPTVKVMDLIVQKDVTIKKGSDYFVQIFATDSLEKDLAKVKARKLAEVKAGRFFSKVVKEEDSGFIFEKQIDSTNVNYDFRHFKIKGDKEYSFQTGLIGRFSLEEVEAMYEGVK